MLLVYGEQRANAGMPGELELDGYQVHRASHAGTLRARFNSGEVDLVIFGRSPRRGLDVLRALRAGGACAGCVRHPCVVDGHEPRDDDELAARVRGGRG